MSGGGDGIESSPPSVTTTPGLTLGSRVAQAGLALVALHLGFRAWASLNSWFYLDDYKLLFEARTSDFDKSYLLMPYNGNLMPGGRVLAWLVAEAGPVDWLVASGLILLLQAVAAIGAWWAFITVFGDRWGALVPLALYLTSAMAIPVMMWWTAGINQVPLQGAFFLALGCWIRYLRTPRVGWLAGVILAVTYGLLFYVKAILILPVLAFLALAYFARGGPVRRVLTVLRGFRYAAVAGLFVGGAYGAYYVTHVTAPFTETTPGIFVRIAGTMILQAFGTAVVGGPWVWNSQPAPNSFANPPLWTAVLAWLFIAAVLSYAFVTRLRTLRAVFLLVAFLTACLTLLVNSRGPVFGSIIGLEYRYLTDAACVAALVVGLLFMDIPGATESSELRAAPLVRPPAILQSRFLPIGLVALIAIGGTVSSSRYVDVWHTRNASDAYLHTLAADLDRRGNVDLAEQEVPDAVYAQIFAPDNRLSRLTLLMDRKVSYPESSDLLAMVDENGHLRRAQIGPGTRSVRGPVKGCGWRIGRPARVVIPLRARAFDFAWWLKISYLSSASTPVDVGAGGTTIRTSLRAGLNDVFVRIEGEFDSVVVSGIDPGVVVCVDTVQVGPVELGDPL